MIGTVSRKDGKANLRIKSTGKSVKILYCREGEKEGGC